MRLHSKSFALHALAAATALAFAQFAGAAAVATTTGGGTVTGSPYAPPTVSGPVSAVVLPAISPGPTSNATITSGAATVTFSGNAAEAATPNTFYYAAPVTYNGTASPFLTTNTTLGGAGVGTYTLSFSTAQLYLGLLWGSISAGDLITFYSGANGTGSVIGTVNGTTAQAAATAFNASNGSQNLGGSQYELINFLNGFQSAVFSETVQASFESANFTYAATNVLAVPEPGSVMLLGIGIAGLVASRRRKAVRV